MKRIAVMGSIAFATLVGCGEPEPGTSVQLSLVYDDGLGLDTADVTVGNRTQSGPIEHRMLLLAPDELASQDVPIEVWARRAGARRAYGTTTVVMRRGEMTTASVTLEACTPGCQGSVLTTCMGPMIACELGCSADGDPHCVAPKPSNGVDPAAADDLSGTTMIAADATFDVDTGAISGAIVRAAGTGDRDGIGYVQLPPSSAGGAPLGVFVFHDLTIGTGATVRFAGARAAVLLVGDTARIAGTIDVSAGHDARSVPGPGGGAGGTLTAAAGGCGPGGPGMTDLAGTERFDGGGGGGGGGTRGANGGEGDLGVAGGAGGTACLASSLEPLRGGSGGGSGGHDDPSRVAAGGGGGGALQLTALVHVELTGTIHAGGAGGEGGPAGTGDGAGAGGGAGGAILVESPSVNIAAGAVLAANGGGGGGGGLDGKSGDPGTNASASLEAAQGGMGRDTGNAGGNGGVRDVAPLEGGGEKVSNGGGGGGAVGAIVIRARALTHAGTSTPSANELDVMH